MAIPTRDETLVHWSSNANAKLTANPGTYNVTPAFATSFDSASDAFVSAFNAVENAREDGTRSEALTATKNATKLALLNLARPLYAAVQKSATISDADKILLGVHVIDNQPSPAIVPPSAPVPTILGVNGSLVSVQVRAVEDPNRRAKPSYASSITICTYVGEIAPADINEWSYSGQSGKTNFDVLFPSELAAGTKVWMTFFWVNSRKQSGPASAAKSALINYGGNIATST